MRRREHQERCDQEAGNERILETRTLTGVRRHQPLQTTPFRGGRLPLEAFVAIAIAVLQVWLIFAHSPWRDEAQAILVAQQPLGRLFGQLHYEGHPALYYLILKAATLVAPGIGALKLTAAACSLATLGLIWWRSPFGFWTKSALSLNYLIFFEYGVIARSYGVGALLFFAFVVTRRQKIVPWVFLALLANVAVHTAILAAVCALWQLREDRWSWKGGAILGLGLGVALLTIWPAHDVIGSYSTAHTPFVRGMVTLAKTSGLLTWSDPTHPVAVWGAVTPLPFALTLGALFPLVGVLALGRNTDHKLLFLICFLTIFAFGTLVYVALLRHLGFAALLMIGLLWAQVEAGERLNATARAWMALAAIGGVWFAVTALFVPFSGAAALSTWAMRSGSVNMPWAASPGHAGVSYSAITGRPTFNLQKGCWNTYQRWNYDPAKPVTDKDITAFTQATGGGYLVGAVQLPAAPGRQLEQVFNGEMSGETTYVYRVRPTGSVRLVTLPNCA